MSEHSEEERLWLVVPAAGRGRRMGTECPKQYLLLNGQPVLVHTLARLHQAFPTARLCLSLDADDTRFDPDWVPFMHWQRTPGGAERVDSVRQALAALADTARDTDLVLVHDVARPCVRVDDLQRLLAGLREDRVGGLLATPAADTMKRDDGQGRVARTASRPSIRAVASSSSIVRPARSTRVVTVVSARRMKPRMSTLTRAHCRSSRGWLRSRACSNSPITGATCCSSGDQAPCTWMVGS